MTGKQLKMWSRETVRLNRIEPAETENLSNSQQCLITLHIVGWVINKNIKMSSFKSSENIHFLDLRVSIHTGFVLSKIYDARRF